MLNKIAKFIAYDGKVSLVCIDSTQMVEEARKIHDLSPVATAAFGRVLTMTAIMANDMKNETDKITVQVKGNGPIGTMLAIANNIPKVKGYIENPQADVPLNDFGKLDVGRAVGSEGFINVVKDIGLKKPYVGISPLVSGEIADDFTKYFVDSEQRQAALTLGVLVNKNGVKAAGGYFITPMPDVTEDILTSIEDAIFKAGPMSRMLDEGVPLEEIAKRITGDEDAEMLEENEALVYECDCSKEKMEKGLKSIGKEKLKEIIDEDGKAEIVCHFCNEKYYFSKEELEEILKRIS